MNAERLLACYERISDAPDAVAHMRRFILKLAVRGKLVAQNPHDEPASGLLKRITEERDRLVKVGEISRNRSKPTRMVDPTFTLPKSWEWVALGYLVLYDAGTKRHPQTLNQQLWLLELEDIEKDSGRLLVRTTASTRESKSTKSEFRSGDILYGKLRPYLNKVMVANEPGYSTTEIVALRPYLPLCSQYFALSLRRPDFVDYVTRLGRGTKMPRLRTEDANVAPFPLPPLAEQHRIVTKVDELMALCEQLEAARTEREATRNRLAAASLARLTAPDPDPTTFQNHAAFALENFTPLTIRHDQIKALRQTILSLAIRGKLTHQDPNEDRRNQRQLRATAEAGRFDARESEDRAMLFNIPVNWTIEPLSRVASHFVDCPHTTPKWTNQGVLCIKTNQVKAGYLDLTTPYFVSEDTYRVRVKRLEPELNDVLYIREGGILGVACLVPPNARLCLGQRLMLIRATCGLVPKFLELCLNSSWIKEFAAEKTTGGAAPRVNMSTIRGYPIPIPPLAEQHRIIAKVDKLLICCNQLETNLANGDDIRRRLLNAILYNSLVADANPRKDYVE